MHQFNTLWQTRDARSFSLFTFDRGCLVVSIDHAFDKHYIDSMLFSNVKNHWWLQSVFLLLNYILPFNFYYYLFIYFQQILWKKKQNRKTRLDEYHSRNNDVMSKYLEVELIQKILTAFISDLLENNVCAWNVFKWEKAFAKPMTLSKQLQPKTKNSAISFIAMQVASCFISKRFHLDG